MLNPYHIKYFFDACRSGSLSEAAKINSVSHSAISHAIRSLESKLDAKLLHHAKRRFHLTSQGQILFEQSQIIIEGLEKATSLVRGANQELRGPLTLGLSHSVALGFTNSKITDYCKKNKFVQPKIFIGNSSTLEELLDSRAVDLGFGIEDGSLERFEKRAFLRGEFILAASRNSKRKLHFLVGDKGKEVSALRATIKKANLSEVTFSEVQSWSIAADLASKGLGVALFPDFILSGRKDLIRVMSDVNLPNYQMSAVCRSFDSLSPVAKDFLAWVKQS